VIAGISFFCFAGSSEPGRTATPIRRGDEKAGLRAERVLTRPHLSQSRVAGLEQTGSRQAAEEQRT
jgi:hypothetical protein